jgi:hypothetical protein
MLLITMMALVRHHVSAMLVSQNVAVDGVL